MKNIKKKAFGILSVSAVALALASCDASRNTKTPTGEFDLNQKYASVARDGLDEISVSYEEMYNKYRSNGYPVVLKELKKAVIRNYINDATYEKNYKSYNTKMLSAIYGVSNFDSFENLIDSEKKDLEKKVDTFVSTEYNTYGVVITEDEANSLKNLITTFADYDVDNLSEALPFEKTLLDKLIDQYSYSVAMTNYSRDYILANYEKDKIYSYDDKKEVVNSNKIDEESIKASYQSTYYKYNQTKAIIVRFKSEAEANRFVEKTNDAIGYSLSDELTAEQKLNWYVKLYNLYNVADKELDPADPFASTNEKKTVFYTDATHTQLANEYSTDMESFIHDGLEDHQCVYSPRNIDGQYALVYRDSVNYYYGDGTGNDWDQVKNLTEAQIKENLDKNGTEFDYYKLTNYEGKTSANLYDYIRDCSIDNKASESLGDTLVLNILKYKSTIEIYDPIYENQFYNTYKDNYTLTKNFDNNLIFKVNVTLDNFTPSANEEADDVKLDEYTYSVADFFEAQDKIYSQQYATELLEYKYLLNSGATQLLTNTEVDGYRDSAKNTISQFNKNQTSYSKTMGVENYLTLTYGITCGSNSEDALNDYLKAQGLVTKYQNYAGYFLTDTTDEYQSTFVDDNNLFATLKKYTDKTKDQYYDISANHIIIQICPETTGTKEDPRKYKRELANKSQALADKFDQGVEELTKIIVNEAKAITDKSVDALAKLVKTFNNTAYDYTLQPSDEYSYKTWQDFKNAYPEFNFYLHSEDLGEITKASAESYVEEFKNYTEALARLIAKNSDLQDRVNDKGVLVDPTSDEFKELGYCETTFGYHILNVYSYKEAVSCKFTYDEDTNGSDESYKNWQHQKVILSQKNPDDTSDDLIVYASGYSKDNYASVQQLFIYYYQTTSSEGVTGLKSTISSSVKTYFADVMSRYNNTNFQAYRLLQQVFGFETYQDGNFSSIKFYNNNGEENTSKHDAYKKYVTKVRINCDNNEELDDKSVFYGWFDENWTVDLTKCSNYHYDN